MSAFAVRLAAVAAGDLDDIPKAASAGMIEDLKGLAVAPLPNGSTRKKLRGFKPPLYRLRSGDYRVLYRIDQATVTILRVINRRTWSGRSAGSSDRTSRGDSPRTLNGLP